MPFPGRSVWACVWIPVAAVVAATVVRLAMIGILGDRFPAITFFVAVVFASWWGGRGPALITLGLSALAVPLILHPAGSAHIQGIQGWVGYGMYLATGLAVALMGGAMRDAAAFAEANEQAALRRGEELRITLRSIGDAVIVIDAKGRVAMLNPVAESLTGWSSDRAIGRPVEEVFRIANEETGAEVEGPVARVMTEGTVVGLANHTVLLAADGSRRPIDDSAAPIRDRSGHLVGVVLVFRDVSERRLTEQKTRASEERLRLALEAGRMGIWDWDLATDRLRWTGNLDQIHGLPTGGFHGTFESFLERIHPDDRVEVERAIVRCVEQKGNYQVEFRVIRPDGSLGWVAGRGRAVVNEEGQCIGMIGVGLDVTARKEAERERQTLLEQLEQERARFEAVLHQLPSGTVVVEAPSRRVILANERSGTILRRPPPARGEVFDFGRSALCYHPDGRPYTPEDLPLIRAVERGELILGETVVYESGPGDRRVLDVNAAPVRDAQGGVTAAVEIFTDITERTRAAQDARFLAEVSATLAALVDEESTLQKVARLAVPFFADWCVVDMADSAGGVRRLAVAHVDPAKVELAHELQHRYPPDPAAPQGVHEILRTGKSEIISEILDELLVQGAQDEEHLSILRELGLRSYLAVPLRCREKTLGVISFIAAESGRRYGPDDLRLAEDLAHRAAIALDNARLYGALKEADRRKGEFLATLAHELRNPLAPIRTTLHALLPRGEADPEFEADRAMMGRQVLHLARLVDDLLDVSRISRGKIELRLEVVDLASAVTHAAEAVRTVIRSREHELTIVLPDAPVALHADPVRLEQILVNLLSNAARYTEPGGRIDLIVTVEGEHVVICVRDSGVGIEPALLENIFEMFVQADPGPGRSREGLGIGLGLVKTLVELHGGSVSASSHGPGTGSEFVVRLPILPPQAARKVTIAQTDENRRSGLTSPLRVLIVDDNTDAAASLARLISRQWSQEVRVAHDGPSTLAIVPQFRPEVVLLDIGLPGMDGYEIARRIRAACGKDAPVLIALTGWGQEEDRRRSKAAGFQHHLVKPVDLGHLRDLLASIAEQVDQENRPTR